MNYKSLFYIVILLLIFSACTKEVEVKKPSNVILITVDTLPARALSAYGAKVKTPNIDALMQSGSVFTRAYSAAPWTKPAIASILSGVLPQKHGVKRMDHKLNDAVPLLAEFFKNSGYKTGAIVSHTIFTPKHGYARGFNEFKNMNTEAPHKAIVSDKVTNMAIKWLKKQNKQEQFFLFLHYFDPHYNYNHHAQYDETSALKYNGIVKAGMDIRKLREHIHELNKKDISYLRALYAEEVRFTDAEIGHLLAYLKESGLDNNTLVVFVADHGEELMERGWIGHTRTLHYELTNIPLAFSFPSSIKKQIISTPVSQVDIVPTILDIVNIKHQSKFDGISLNKVLTGNGQLDYKRPIFSDVDFISSSHVKDAFKTCVVSGNYKLIHNRDKSTFELYDLNLDPTEKKNIKDEKPTVYKTLAEFILQYEELSPQVQQESIQITPDEIKQLQSLGYM